MTSNNLHDYVKPLRASAELEAVFVHANQLAAQQESERLFAMHVLAAIAENKQSSAVIMLKKLHTDSERLLRDITVRIHSLPTAKTYDATPSDEVVRLLQSAAAEAVSLGDTAVDARHFLLATIKHSLNDELWVLHGLRYEEVRRVSAN